jgi:hypothetical protein
MMSRPRFRTRRTEDSSQDPHWQDIQSPTSWLHLRPVPYKRDPQDKSLPRTRSRRLARKVSALLDLPPAPTCAWSMTHGASLGREHHYRHTWGTIPHAMQIHQLAAMQAADPNETLTLA